MTKKALSLFVNEARSYDPTIKLFGVLCSTERASWWKQSFESLDVVYIHEPVAAVELAQAQGMSVTVNDFAHWNILGNEIFGKQLVREIKRYLELWSYARPPR